jgi:hypothetical protein
MTRRILQSIKLDKIACVDHPCQQHALAAIIKRRPEVRKNVFGSIANVLREPRFDPARQKQQGLRAFGLAPGGRRPKARVKAPRMARGGFRKEEHTMNLDQLNKQVDDLLRKIDRALAMDSMDGMDKRVQHFQFSHDDGESDDNNGGSMDDTWSEHADSEADGNNADMEDDGDDEEEEDGDLGKASINPFLRTNDTAQRPGALSSSTHPQSRHKFEALADKIKNEEGLPPSESHRQARLRFPDVYASFQRHTANNGSGSYFKRAPAFEALVEREMRKGFSYQVAAQRIQNLYGSAAPHTTMAKAAAAQADFADAAQDIYQEDAGLSRCESMRKARLDNPQLYKRMQRV